MIVFILYPRAFLDTKSFPVSAADPGEGPGGPASPVFWTKLRPEGPKKKGRPPPHLRVWMTCPPPNLKVCIHHWVKREDCLTRQFLLPQEACQLIT